MSMSPDLQRSVLHTPPRLVPVLSCLLDGMSNHGIADETGLSLHTVENYVSELLAHFECESRTALVVRLRDVPRRFFTI